MSTCETRGFRCPGLGPRAMALALSGWASHRLISRPRDQGVDAKNTRSPARGEQVPSETSLGWLSVIVTGDGGDVNTRN